MPKKAGKDKEMDKIQIYATQLGLSTIIAAISTECDRQYGSLF